MFYPIEVKCEITTKRFWVRLLVEGVGWWLGCDATGDDDAAMASEWLHVKREDPFSSLCDEFFTIDQKIEEIICSCLSTECAGIERKVNSGFMW